MTKVLSELHSDHHRVINVNNGVNLMRTAKVVSISLPPDMQEEVTKIASEERRSVSEVLREAFRQYAASRALGEVRKQAKKTAKSKQIKPNDVAAIVSQGRR